MRHESLAYTVGFTGIVCAVCSVLVSTSAVSLHERQKNNVVLDRQKKVLAVAGLLPDGRISRATIESIYQKNIRARVIDLASGEVAEDIDVATFDQQAAAQDPATSQVAPANAARVKRVPTYGMVYEVTHGANVDLVVIPIEGKGLWSTLYGYLALGKDANTIAGITFYQHGETPGLGGEVDNPKWKSLWQGRKAFDERGEVRLSVIKGNAGPPASDPYQVDGLSGATLTSRGVSALVKFWLSETGFGPYLDKFRERSS